jgi:hypothetical protein
MKWATTMAVVVVGAVSLVLAGAARGGVITFGLVVEYSGAAEPQGPRPWLTATFDDEGTPGSVKLTLDTTNLVGGESVKEWYFNLNPDLDPSALSFTVLNRGGMFDDPTCSLEKNAYKADGDGYFDILFAFTTAEGSGSDERFGVGDSVEYSITGIAGLVASSFDYLSADNKGVPLADGFYTAAHVLSIFGDPCGTSGWVATPEPATLVLMAMGGVGMLLSRRRRV